MSHPGGRANKMKRAAAPRYADPWSFRCLSSGSFQPAADLLGRPLLSRCYRRGGCLEVVSLGSEPHPANHLESDQTPQRSSLAALRRRQSATFTRYRLARWCTVIELSTIEALWFEGVSLRDLARREGVSPAAISSRIAGLSHKAPEFANWWRLKNSAHQRRTP
jgi:hypothetical protein